MRTNRIDIDYESKFLESGIARRTGHIIKRLEQINQDGAMFYQEKLYCMSNNKNTNRAFIIDNGF